MTVYIYALTDENNVYRYIGATTNIEARFAAHLHDDSGSPKAAWIQGLLKNNKKPNIVIIEETTHELANEREQYWIEHYSYAGLLNILRSTYKIKKQAKEKHVITLRISDDLLTLLKARAQKEGLPYQTLMKIWLREKVAE